MTVDVMVDMMALQMAELSVGMMVLMKVGTKVVM